MSKSRYAFDQPGRYARGWHILAFSQELQRGDIKPLHYFGQELVLFRGHSGKAVVLDAYCPHLGAHLGGLGSQVVEDTLRCPFHGWQFDQAGSCVHIPYSDVIPSAARQALRSWPLCELNGFIALWHDHEGGAPDYPLPEIPTWGPKNWGDWAFRRSTIKSHGKDIVENIVDLGHFASVHGSKAQVFENFFDEHTVTQFARLTTGDPNATQQIVPRGLSYDLEVASRLSPQGTTSESWSTYHGPAIMYSHMENPLALHPYKSWCINYYTPIDDEQVEVASATIVAPHGDQALPPDFMDTFPQTVHASFWQDVSVWQTKIYRNEPILCAGDGQIAKLRQWYEQFYLPKRS